MSISDLINKAKGKFRETQDKVRTFQRERSIARTEALDKKAARINNERLIKENERRAERELASEKAALAKARGPGLLGGGYGSKVKSNLERNAAGGGGIFNQQAKSGSLGDSVFTRGVGGSNPFTMGSKGGPNPFTMGSGRNPFNFTSNKRKKR